MNTPLDAPRAVADDWRNNSIYSQRLWGSYRYSIGKVYYMYNVYMYVYYFLTILLLHRSNVYFGMRPRIPK